MPQPDRNQPAVDPKPGAQSPKSDTRSAGTKAADPKPPRMKGGPAEELEDTPGKVRPTPRIDHDDPVEEASDESFPASDPPAR